VTAKRPFLALLASTAVVTAAATGTGEAPDQVAQVDWCRTKDAAWVGRVITAAGYGKKSCSGAAFVVGSRGRDLYVWATSELGSLSDRGRRVRIAGVVVRYGRVRAAWRAHRRRVWVEAGPTTARLWPVWRLRALVCASVKTR
jgi:hypothetical protein